MTVTAGASAASAGALSTTTTSTTGTTAGASVVSVGAVAGSVDNVLDTLYGAAKALVPLPLNHVTDLYHFYLELRRVEGRTGFLTERVRMALLSRCPLTETTTPPESFWSLLEQDPKRVRQERYFFVHKCLRFLPRLRSLHIAESKLFPLHADTQMQGQGLAPNHFPALESAQVHGTRWKVEEVLLFFHAIDTRSPGQFKSLTVSRSYGPRDADLESLSAHCGGRLHFL